jgi:sphingomyelin phosphodiesterase acid-like 3
MRLPFLFRSAFATLAAALTIACCCVATTAQTPAQPSTANILMLSDIHLDPFHDPGKAAALIASPVSGWQAILAGPPSTNPPVTFDQLQNDCKSKGVDTPYALLASSLAAEQAQLPTPAFVTVSGDLTVHKLDCRLKILAPTLSASDYSKFAAKIVEFVALELHTAFPKSPVYLAMGNNDSGCGDYEEDHNSGYLDRSAKSFASAVLSKGNKDDIEAEFPDLGDYNIKLPAPFQNTRLIVLQDIFESKKYQTCKGKDSDSEAKQQIAWLDSQLKDAKAKGEHVWVMAHIPPGIDGYSTAKSGNICTDGGKPTVFLGSEALGDTFSDYTSTITLILLGHTHMDEMRLYSSPSGSKPGAIPARLTPSITPVDGNNPSFTIGVVDPKKAELLDYTVYAASNQTGIGTTWSEEYDFGKTYGYSSFSASALTDLTQEFIADTSGTKKNSQSYQSFYFVMPASGPLSNVAKSAAWSTMWPMYTCSMTQDHKKDYLACTCPAKAQ